MCDLSRRRSSSTIDNHRHFESDDETAISAFGYPKINHGWVECLSKSFPGQTYYFNVDTCCSTWYRPVSRYIPMRLSRPLNLMSDDDFLDDAPIDVSDIDDENDYEEDESYEEEINPDLPPDADDVKPPMIIMKETKVSRDTKIYAEVLFKLYHCYNRDCDDNEIEDVAPLNCETADDDLSDNIASILPETCYSSDSESELTGSEFVTAAQKRINSETSEDQESFVEVSREDDDEFSELDYLKILHTDHEENENREFSSNISGNEEITNRELSSNFSDNEEIKNRELSSNFSSSSESDIGSRDMGLSSDDEDDDEDEEDEKSSNECLFSLPRLKAIEFADLARPRKIRKKTAKKRKSSNNNNEILKETPPNKMIKIVCEVNGVTTVNYDYYEPELPSGVKMSNLSDSGSSECYDAWYSQGRNNANNNCPDEKRTEDTKTFDYLNDFMDFSEPDLSDSSTSSTTSASSLEARRNRAKKILTVTKEIKGKENTSSGSSSSSSSSESSWRNSESSSDNDD